MAAPIPETWHACDTAWQRGVAAGPAGEWAPAALNQLKEDVFSLWAPRRVARVSAADVTAFLRDHVATRTPCILTDLVERECPWIMQHGDLAALRRAVGDAPVSVNETPDGLADAVKVVAGQPLFVTPLERTMPFSAFCDALQNPGPYALYLSRQNDSLRAEFPQLCTADCGVPESLAFARGAFGNDADAVNLWVGTESALTSLHKDPYENLYAVLAGEKQFTLLPPPSTLWLRELSCPHAQYVRCAGSCGGGGEGGGDEACPWREAPMHGAGHHVVSQPDGEVPWVVSDPGKPCLACFPELEGVEPLTCTVRPGEVLYLPALWYHAVAQRGVTIAVNWWHDMAFDAPHYPQYCFARRLSGKDA